MAEVDNLDECYYCTVYRDIIRCLMVWIMHLLEEKKELKKPGILRTLLTAEELWEAKQECDL